MTRLKEANAGRTPASPLCLEYHSKLPTCGTPRPRRPNWIRTNYGSIIPTLIQERKLAIPTVLAQIAALRFFYVKTLGRLSPQFRIPSPKLPKRMPAVLSREEVRQLIAAAFPSLQRYHASFQQRKMIRAIGVTMATVQNPTPKSAGPGAIRQCPV